MYDGVAIDLTGRGLQNFYLQAFSKAEHIDRANDACLGRLHWILLVVDWRCRAGKIKDLVDLHKKGMCNIVAQQFKTLVIEQMFDVVPCASEEIIHAENLAAALQQLLAEMRAEKSSSARNKDASLKMLQQNPLPAGP